MMEATLNDPQWSRMFMVGSRATVVGACQMLSASALAQPVANPCFPTEYPGSCFSEVCMSGTLLFERVCKATAHELAGRILAVLTGEYS